MLKSFQNLHVHSRAVMLVREFDLLKICYNVVKLLNVESAGIMRHKSLSYDQCLQLYNMTTKFFDVLFLILMAQYKVTFVYFLKKLQKIYFIIVLTDPNWIWILQIMCNAELPSSISAVFL